jgi:CrcB protein
MGRRWVLVAFVALGGAIGTAGRYGVGLIEPSYPGAVPWPTLTVNLVGAFLLGFLLEAIAAPDYADAKWHEPVRLGLGTGLLGAFTTYGAFALEVDSLLMRQFGLAALYALVTVLGGIAVAAIGISLGRRTW